MTNFLFNKKYILTLSLLLTICGFLLWVNFSADPDIQLKGEEESKLIALIGLSTAIIGLITSIVTLFITIFGARSNK